MSELTSLHSAMDRLFADLFDETSPSRSRSGDGGQMQVPTYRLPVDIEETKNGYRVYAPVPGFNPEEVEVSHSDGVLTINARHSEERNQEEGGYIRREMIRGNLVRMIPLPSDVRAEDIQANFENGVLTIEVPRTARPQPKRIAVGRKSSDKQMTQEASAKRSQQEAASRK